MTLNFDGKSLKQACKEKGLNYDMVKARKSRGDDLFADPKTNKKKIEVDGKTFESLTEAVGFYGLKYHTIKKRLREGWSVERAFKTDKNPRLLDLVGQKFERLTVIEKIESDKKENAKWKCLCVCGNYSYPSGYDLISENSRSCGCLQRELAGQCAGAYNTSQGEIELLEFLKECGYVFEKSRKAISGFELDGFCPELKMAVEYCGLYWHSDLKIANNYHHKKYLACCEAGIKLFTIFEDEWQFRQPQVKQFLKAQLGKFDQRIFARDCVVEKVDKDTAYSFFENNHIQGKPHIILTSFGLLHQGDLMGCVSFAAHHRQYTDTVLNRLAFKNDVQILGGASKLLKNSFKMLNVDKIVTWSDNRWSSGKIYEKSGFSFDGDLPPDYSYYKKNKRFSKQSQKKNAVNCPPDLTEHQWAIQRGFNRIYDCGKKRWCLK